MQTRPLGQSGIEASVVAFGAWAIGGWMWGGTDEDEAVKAIHAALDHGINLIDTAPAYGFGLSERIVGQAIADRRDKVVLATKCALVTNTHKGVHKFNSDTSGPAADGHIAVHIYLHPDSVRAEVEASLRRMKTDHVDLLQTHWQDETTPIADTMGALMDLKAEGKIRAIGACNANVQQLEEYAAAGQLDVDQEVYSMLDRGIEQSNLPYCLDNNVAVLAYSPLSRGLLTGKIGPERKFGVNDSRIGNPRFSVENRWRVVEMLDTIQPIADAHGLTHAQLVIAWTLQQPGLTHALCGARNPQQAIENAKAGTVTLSGEELALIDQAAGDLLLSA